jgi:hypothetical protein
MTEEVVSNENENTDQAPEAPKLSAIQEKALEQGWKPKDQFEGEEDEFIDAAEFVRRGELFSKIDHQGKELKAVRQALDALRVHHTKVAQTEYNRALKTLQESRKEAIENGDTEQAFAIQDQIDTVKAERVQIDIAPVQELNPEFVEWTERNTWYSKDEDMRVVADKFGIKLHEQGKSPAEVLKLVEAKIKDTFPHKFANANRDRPNAVESSSRSGKSVSRGNDGLSEDETQIMRKIVRSGVMTEAQYKAELKKVKG